MHRKKKSQIEMEMKRKKKRERERERERKETNDFCQNGRKTFRIYCSFESAVAE